MKLRAAFQGELGAFSQVAARQLAGDDCIPVPLLGFEDVFVSVVNGKCHCAVIPIENTLHGSVHENYDHLLKYDLPIRGETFVRIVHNIICPPRSPRRMPRRSMARKFSANRLRTIAKTLRGSFCWRG